jgi:hypothetical protein
MVAGALINQYFPLPNLFCARQTRDFPPPTFLITVLLGTGTHPCSVIMKGTDASEPRTLLLAPASVAGQEAALKDIFSTYNRSTSDLQMLDRLASGLVNLPESTYDLVVVLTDARGVRRSEALQWLTRTVYDLLATSMKNGAILEAQDGPLPVAEPTLAGLIQRKDGQFEKVEETTIKLNFGAKKKKNTGNGVAGAGGNGVVQIDLNQLDDDDELVDENDLLTKEDLERPYPQPRKSLAFFFQTIYTITNTAPGSPGVSAQAWSQTTCL